MGRNSLDKWQRALSNPDGTELTQIKSTVSFARTALLTPIADVIDRTPSQIPFQYGRMYSYMLVTWIPRFLWPEKPSMSDANQFYQLAYGVTRDIDLPHISISIGTLGEAYINFGWFGALTMMLLIGMFFDFWRATFFGGGQNQLAMAIGIALVPQLIAVEFQLAQYLSGIAQDIALVMLLFLPALRIKKARPAAAPMVPRVIAVRP